MYLIVLILAASANFSTAISSIAAALGVLFIIFKTIHTETLPKINPEYVKIFGVYFLCQFLIAMLSAEPPTSFREFAGEVHRCFPFFFAILFVRSKYQLRNILIIILFCNIIDDLCACYQKFFLEVETPPAFNKSPVIFESFLLMQLPVQIFISTLSIIPTWAKRLSIFACALTIFSAVNVTNIQENFQLSSEKIDVWQTSIQMFENYPVHGVGQKMFSELNNFDYASTKNTFLNVAAEGGVLGIFAFTILHGYFLIKFFKLHSESDKKISAGLIALITLILLMTAGLFTTNMNQVSIMREYWLIIGLMFAAHRLENRNYLYTLM